jgi:uncharacterized phiE125 gp8 family phage protein
VTPYVVLSPPAEQPLNVVELKAHLRIIDDDGGQDVLLANLIGAATQAIERTINRAMVQRTLRATLDQFPVDGRPILLPMPPAISVSAVQYIDSASQQQTIVPADYRVDVASQPARLHPTSSAWPEAKRMTGSVSADYIAGYGTADDVPLDLRHAVLLLAAHWHEHSEAASALSLHETPQAFNFLVDNYRVPQV